MKVLILSVAIFLCFLQCFYCQDDFENVKDYRTMMESLGKTHDISREAKELSDKVLEHLISNRHNPDGMFQPEVFLQNLEESQVPEKSYNISDQCLNHTLMLFDGVFSKEWWAIAMLDAVGKLPSGVVLGNVLWLGTYSQCVNATASYVTSKTNDSVVVEYPYTGQYCMATITNSTIYGEQKHKDENPLFQMATGGLRLGVCVPDSCSEEDTRGLVNTGLYFLPKDIEAISVKCQPKSIEVDAPAIGVSVIVSILAAIIIAGTLYDILVYQPSLVRPLKTHIVDGIVGTEQNGDILTTEDTARLVEQDSENKKREQSPTITVKLLLSFSVFTNGGKILNTVKREGSLDAIHGIRFLSMSWVIWGHNIFFALQSIGLYHKILTSFSFIKNGSKLLGTKQSSESLTAIHGVRFFSMAWVIWGHTYFFALSGNQLENLAILPKVAGEWTYQILTSGTLSVDSFFLLSGLLLSYLTLKEMKKRGGPKNVNWAMFYFHRFWRLTPPYMLILGIHTALFKYIGSGPMWPTTGVEPFCPKNWWTNFLYINNLVNPSEACMGWAWYLANDMQFFILSPLFLIPLYMSGLIGTIITFGVMMISFITTGVIAAKYEFPASVLAMTAGTANSTGNYFNDLYIVPWTRIGPYLVGILVGYVLYRTERKVKMHWLLAAGGWILAALFCLSTLYGLTGVNRGDYENSVVVNALYHTLARTVWSLGLAWVIFACVTGYGGFVNTLLSWSAIVPLSRLTYMAYLVHPIVMYWYYSSRERLIFFQDTTMTYFFLGHLVISYGVAFVASLSLEAPMMGLEKVIFHREKSK